MDVPVQDGSWSIGWMSELCTSVEQPRQLRAAYSACVDSGLGGVFHRSLDLLFCAELANAGIRGEAVGPWDLRGVLRHRLWIPTPFMSCVSLRHAARGAGCLSFLRRAELFDVEEDTSTRNGMEGDFHGLPAILHNGCVSWTLPRDSVPSLPGALHDRSPQLRI